MELAIPLFIMFIIFLAWTTSENNAAREQESKQRELDRKTKELQSSINQRKKNRG